MRKNVFGRQLRRDKNQRKALFRSLMSSLVLDERIRTTEAKAKSIKSQVEKLVTTAKRKGDKSWNLLQKHLMPHAIDKMILEIAPRFTKREGGFTRIIRLGERIDSAKMVIIEWVDRPEVKVENLGIKEPKKEEKLAIPGKVKETKKKEAVKKVKETKKKSK
ncbi:50S ribosomal protein L17 [Candidatus Microgenomates bacterium]|nr:MAG: 50S ribosomal protein L17 [Candidatus Microgenomates bacterium]